MKKILLISSLIALSITISGCISNKIKHSVTQTALVSGNCGMCKEKIEKAGTEAKVSKVEWSAENQLATITYNPQKTTKSKILRKIADAGYSNEAFKADAKVYNELPGCCQYSEKQSENAPDEVVEEKPHDHDYHDHNHPYMSKATEIDDMEKTGLEWLYEGCYKLTNSLKIGDYTRTADIAGSMYRGIDLVQDSSIDEKALMTWKKFKAVIQADVSGIANSTDVNSQRKFLSLLSQNTFALMNLDKPKSTSYLYLCTFPGGMQNKPYYWVSKSEIDKISPYGFKDFCGSVINKVIIK